MKHADFPEKDHDDYLLVKGIFEKGLSKLGWRSVQMRLLNKGIIMNHKKISRIMKKYGLHTKIRRVNPYRMIMKKTLEHTTFANKLNREFNQSVPFKMFCTDITYVSYHHHMAYVSTIKDIASNEIVGWNVSQHLGMGIVLDTLKSMKESCKERISSFHGILIHSDQGFHYTNPLYVKEVEKLEMVQSMSRKGNCIDNAPMESFFGHMKDDVDYKSCRTFQEVSIAINDYIEYYNNERYQWDLKKMTPAGYRNHLLSLCT